MEETEPSLFKFKAGPTDFIPKYTDFTGKGENVGASSSTWQALPWSGDESQHQVINHTDCVCPWYDVMQLALYLCDLPLQTHNPGLIMRKKTETNPNSKHSTKYLASTP